MDKVRAVKFCTYEDYIKYCQSDDKSLQKGAWLLSLDPFLHAQLWTLKKFCHGTPLTEINNAVDGGPVSHSFDGGC